MPTYKNKPVTVVGEAKQGDQGFDPNTAKTKIRHQDGKEEVVNKSELFE